MNIGFDLDDVLLDFMNSLIPYHNNVFGTNNEREHFKNNDIASIWSCTKEEEIQRVFDFFASPEHLQASPIPGAVEGIRNLKEHHNLSVITARPEELKEKTIEWLEKHYANMFDGIYFTNQYHGSGPKRSKGEICHELGVNIFVDDILENAEDVVSFGIPVLLFDKPWNQAEVRSPITRVRSWEEIMKILSQ
ncbi:MAG: hypothetical protein CO183_00770 [Candidatus Zambryskibacteria bacterium CG_4_9_14_3_um_filter_42_9]|uniref:Nucleotidase n=1 Tax=Candidatus Zambryskibacteria bacterium CG22_combo_CG10-13_8_21_14_all_42_17 TaxID=1975118 RepID=A0A2H0BFM6_9BACT|nr:MAG: hypothetical protein COX06_01415 [Candidatus Zambryskibacteria bacterium CG22_combo_CG10-13_8_21_14_all_42_17]PJA36952.1 MAG: hypothetical protein CO183_00770 [Candidatus Zambryskibacteria bacterium CG_4_9_14_3_um_filter_42_9]